MREQDPLAFIWFDLPFIGRVRFSDINNEELDLITETAMKFGAVPSLGTKRRSGIAPEDQSYRLSAAKRREQHLLSAA